MLRKTLVGELALLGMLTGSGMGFCQSEKQPANPKVQSIPVEIVIEEGDANAALSSKNSYTLLQLEQLAQENNPRIREAAAKVEITRGKAQQAGLYPNPVLRAEAGQIAGRDSQYLTSLSQEIITKRKRKLDQSVACQEVRKAEFDFVKERFDLLTEVRSSFYATLSAQRKVETLQELLRIAQQSKDAAEKMLRGGEATRPDVLQMEIELDKSQVALANTLVQYKASKRQLAAIVGTPKLEIEKLTGDLAIVTPDFRSDGYRDSLILSNSQIQAAQTEFEKARVGLRRAEVEPFPNITVEAGYQYSVTPNNNQGVLGVSFPIPVWNRNQGNIRSARAEIGRSAESIEKVQNDLLSKYAAALGRWAAANDLVDAYEKRIRPKAKETFDLTQKGFGAGQFDFPRVLQVQRTRIETDLIYITALEARLLAAVELAGYLQIESFP